MKWIAVAIVLVSVLTEGSASAQVIGTFRWGFAPYCNVVTLLVEQKGSLFELMGTDDGCNGAAPAAAVNGSAHFNPGGTVGLSLTIVRSDAFVVVTTIELNPSTLSGTWRDNWENSGTFTFNPALPVAAPPRRLTMRGDWSVVYPAIDTQSQGRTSISFAHPLPGAPGAARGNIIPVGGVPTANCPGTIADPRAAPGQLCLYQRLHSNASTVAMFSASTGSGDEANPNGFSILVNAAGPGNVFVYGRWAVSVP